MTVLGIFASRFVAQGDFESIASTTVGAGGVANVEFTSIPGTYQHLQVRMLVKSEAAGSSFTTLEMKINGNSLTSNHYLYGNGASVLAGTGGTNVVVNIPQAGYTDRFAVAVMDILDYANTNKNKTIRTLGGVDTNGAGELVLYSNLYATNTNAITSLTFTVSGGSDINQYSSIALYGIKG